MNELRDARKCEQYAAYFDRRPNLIAQVCHGRLLFCGPFSPSSRLVPGTSCEILAIAKSLQRSPRFAAYFSEVPCWEVHILQKITVECSWQWWRNPVFKGTVSFAVLSVKEGAAWQNIMLEVTYLAGRDTSEWWFHNKHYSLRPGLVWNRRNNDFLRFQHTHMHALNAREGFDRGSFA